ncbi:hypothetical protein ACFUIW_21570 [Streptomyces sp. NPDC057245]|uniref:hypothetical protein n=1 Tax=Streptomyces sp. NPDC057245 TaxID=3346065 RepID=UPI00363E1E3F
MDSLLVALDGVLRLADRCRGRIEAATAAARRAGGRDKGVVYLGGADNDRAGPAEAVKDPTCGHPRTSSQYTAIREQLALHGVHVRPAGEKGAYVPLRQPLRALVPLLLDERATYHLTAGEPDTHC